jgi:hypothetical protein
MCWEGAGSNFFFPRISHGVSKKCCDGLLLEHKEQNKAIVPYNMFIQKNKI